MRARETRRPHDAEALAGQVRESVQTVVQRQVGTGIDVPSDGEFSKTSFNLRERPVIRLRCEAPKTR